MVMDASEHLVLARVRALATSAEATAELRECCVLIEHLVPLVSLIGELAARAEWAQIPVPDRATEVYPMAVGAMYHFTGERNGS